MWKVLIKIVEKWACMHDWEIMTSTHYIDRDRHLLRCKKCGKLKKKAL